MYEPQKAYYKKNQEELKTKAKNAYHQKKLNGTFFSIRYYKDGVNPFVDEPFKKMIE
tara:strand:+ start:1169 stop:1339 length:171 start_codon:yes stop_codon:yes gene_type:complete